MGTDSVQFVAHSMIHNVFFSSSFDHLYVFRFHAKITTISDKMERQLNDVTSFRLCGFIFPTNDCIHLILLNSDIAFLMFEMLSRWRLWHRMTHKLMIFRLLRILSIFLSNNFILSLSWDLRPNISIRNSYVHSFCKSRNGKQCSQCTDDKCWTRNAIEFVLRFSLNVTLCSKNAPQLFYHNGNYSVNNSIFYY